MINVLMNTSMIDEAWCRPILKKIIHPDHKVCIVALSFFDDTKNEADWNKQFKEGQGIWYRANQDVFYSYGIKKEQIQWINYFSDSMAEMAQKISQADILLFTGGAPDLMMQRIKEKKLKKVLKAFDGIVIGYSAGAMIQLDDYHITPDSDYPNFAYLKGLGYLKGFDIEVHYTASKRQHESMERVQEEKKVDLYGIYEKGGLLIEGQHVTCFGKVDFFERKKDEKDIGQRL